MVIRSRHIIFCFILLISFVAVLTHSPMVAVQAASTNTVSQEWVHLWINTDGSIDVQYNITYRYLSGTPQGIFELGMPKSGFKINYIRDLSNNPLKYTDISGGNYYGIDITVGTLLNHNYTFIVNATVPGMVSEDSTNPNNVGMSFYTPTFDTATGPVVDLRVRMELPSGVTSSEVRYPTGLPFDNVITGGTNIAVYWQRSNWPATQQLTTGVSFPAKYVNLGPSIWFYLIIILGIVAVIVTLIVIFGRIRKTVYEKPKVSIEALGAARGLTAVEAAVVVGSKPVIVLMMILFGMLKKRYITVKETTPLIRLEATDSSIRDTKSPIRYYEIDFMKSIGPNGTLDEQNLARTFLSLRENVDSKMRGYSRVDTANYYKSVVDNAWSQVTQAGTPELKGEAIDQNLEWLLMDEKYDARFKQALPLNLMILPSPGWWWYWHGPYFSGGRTSNPSVPSTPTEVKPMPAQEWANNIVKGLETTTNNIVKNIQDFTNKLVASQSTQSSKPVRQGSNCVCACAHCACACACVSCACACAHGGGR